MTVQILTDSGCDVTPELAAAHGITVIPLQVLINGETYRDGVDLTPDEFYAKMRGGKELPKTSLPTLHDIQEAYKAALARGPVLGVHLSSALSGTWQTVTMTARAISESIHTFDTLSGSGGSLLQVLEAARMAREGASVEQILARLEVMRGETHTLVALNTLENAVKGGRVSPLAGMAASLLGIKPIVHVSREGKVVPIDKVRGRTKALDRVLEIAAERCSNWKDRMVVVAHGSALADAEAFAKRVRERFNPKEIITVPIGATIGTYSAEGAILFSF